MGNRAVDVCGVICQMGDKDEINLKSGGTKTRRQLSIVDDTSCSIQMTMWGDALCDQAATYKLG